MLSLIKRNLKLYFNSWSNVLLSLVGALISFVLYIIFLKHNILQSWQDVPDTKLLLDPWLIGGTLTVTAVTTTLNSIGQMITDRDNGTIRDFAITPVSFLNIQLAYLISSFIIGVCMQIVIYFVLDIYFKVTDGLHFSLATFWKILPIMLVSSLVWTIINAFIMTFIKNNKSVGTVNSIVGTAAGFFAGVYIPIGLVPKFAQTLMKLTPAPYDAALYRDVLMKQQLHDSFKRVSDASFKKLMGVNVDWNGIMTFNHEMLIMFLFAGIVLLFLILKSNKMRKIALRRG
ncbi:ABC transporter permease [Fructilactobacillus sp. Tb1]|uniref:ABC transporter permease n=1 Tax=Fructilactobacillus sp. Tb1 TaxID=3422304 RepID=UPI003D26C8D2